MWIRYVQNLAMSLASIDLSSTGSLHHPGAPGRSDNRRRNHLLPFGNKTRWRFNNLLDITKRNHGPGHNVQ